MPPIPFSVLDHARPVWPSDMSATVTIGVDGLVLGAGTVLAPLRRNGARCGFAEGSRFSLDPERILALLSVVARQPVSARALKGIEAAANQWVRGDRALAAIRLLYAGLPRLDEPADADRLRAADGLLARGMTPCALMKQLGLDTAALDAVACNLAKYSPVQPRVPAGSGAESGRWTDGNLASLL